MKIIYYPAVWLLIYCILVTSCQTDVKTSRRDIQQERIVYDKLFEESEEILKKGIFKDKKWVNVVYTKDGNRFNMQNIINLVFVKNSLIVEVAGGTVYRFDKDSGDIKWITELSPSTAVRTTYKANGGLSHRLGSADDMKSYFFFDGELDKNIRQYEQLAKYYTYCISNVKVCIDEYKQKYPDIKIKSPELQKKIYESRKFELEQKLTSLKNSFLIYTIRQLKLIAIDYYSGSIKFEKYLPSLPVTRPFFFNGYITYFSSDRNRFVWVDPFEFVEEFQQPLDSLPGFIKLLSGHIFVQDRNSIKYFDNNKLYWTIKINSNVLDAVDLTNYAFVITDDREMLFINLLSGRIEWKTTLSFKVEKLFKYAGYLFLKSGDSMRLIDLKTINKLLKIPRSYYELKVKKTINGVKRFLFGDKDFLYFLGIDNIIKKFRTTTLENIDSISGLTNYIFIWEYGSNDVLLYRKPSFLYYFNFSE